MEDLNDVNVWEEAKNESVEQNIKILYLNVRETIHKMNNIVIRSLVHPKI